MIATIVGELVLGWLAADLSPHPKGTLKTTRIYLVLTLAVAILASVMAFTPAAAAAPQPGFDSGSIYDDGMPPVKYQGDVIIPVLAYAGNPADREVLCDANVPSGMVLLGCVLPNGATVLPNPCAPEFAGEKFAIIACHELGHSNGWPGTHPRPAVSEPAVADPGFVELINTLKQLDKERSE